MIVPPMRRNKQLLSKEETAAILCRGHSGVLALSDGEGYPYALPLSYIYEGDRIYFHCAKAGHKLDLIGENPKVSFCVVDQDQIVPEEYTTYFRSAIVFGQVRVLTDPAEKRAAIEKLARKYAPEDSEAHRQAAIDRDFEPLVMLEMQIDAMTGKEAIELVRQR